MENQYSYITVMSNERYLPGVIALKRALEETNAKYPLHVIIPQEQAEKLDAELKKYDIKSITRPYISRTNKASFENSYWNHTFFKLAITSLVEFDKIVFLDSDMLILNNLDELFLKPNLSAVVAGKAMNPEWVELNSGLMVIEPDMDMYNRLIEEIDNTIKERNDNGLACGDQDVFAKAYPKWKHDKSLQLDEKYNTFYGEIAKYFKKKIYKKKRDVSVVHFVGSQKPWEYTPKRKMMLLLLALKNFSLKPWWYLKKYMQLTKLS